MNRIRVTAGALLAALLASVASIGPGSPARACSCEEPDGEITVAELAESVRHSDLVTAGVVTGWNGDPGSPRWSVGVTGALVGDVEGEITLEGEDWAEAGCGPDLRPWIGREVVIRGYSAPPIVFGCQQFLSVDEWNEIAATAPPVEGVVALGLGSGVIHGLNHVGEVVATVGTGTTSLSGSTCPDGRTFLTLDQPETFPAGDAKSIRLRSLDDASELVGLVSPPSQGRSIWCVERDGAVHAHLLAGEVGEGVGFAIHVVPLDGASVVGWRPGGDVSAPSGDGRVVVFERENGSVHVARLPENAADGGRESSAPWDSGEEPQAAAWAPGGRELLVGTVEIGDGDVTGTMRLRTVTLDDGGLVVSEPLTEIAAVATVQAVARLDDDGVLAAFTDADGNGVVARIDTHGEVLARLDLPGDVRDEFPVTVVGSGVMVGWSTWMGFDGVSTTESVVAFQQFVDLSDVDAFGRVQPIDVAIRRTVDPEVFGVDVEQVDGSEGVDDAPVESVADERRSDAGDVAVADSASQGDPWITALIVGAIGVAAVIVTIGGWRSFRRRHGDASS